jgi:hypothetical protein
MRRHHIEQVWKATEDLKDGLRFSVPLVTYDITRLRRLLWNEHTREHTIVVGDMLCRLGSLLELHTLATNAKFKKVFQDCCGTSDLFEAEWQLDRQLLLPTPLVWHRNPEFTGGIYSQRTDEQTTSNALDAYWGTPGVSLHLELRMSNFGSDFTC